MREVRPLHGGGLASLHNKQTECIPIFNKLLYRRGLDCGLIETSRFTNFIVPPADNMVVAVTDSLNYHLDTARGKTTLHALLSSFTAVGLDVSQHQLAVNG
jgi:hypothetical protein